MSEWIKCSERLPDIDTIVLAFTQGGQPELGMLFEGEHRLRIWQWLGHGEMDGWDMVCENVTHWQYLPEPPP